MSTYPFSTFYNWFWSEPVWLPKPVTWSEIKSTDRLRMPHISDVYILLPLVISIIIIRQLFERLLVYPLLKWYGVKEKGAQNIESNEILEKVYQNLTGQLEIKQITNLASTLGWTVKKVRQWFKNKKSSNRPSKMKKCQEASWRFVFYTCTSIWGFVAVRKEGYLYDTRHIWIGYPKHNLSDGVCIYYLVELAFYWTLLIFQFADIKRKDFVIQTVHHILTITLLTCSFISNFIRVGVVVLLVHDISDVFLEIGKLCKYLKLEKCSDVIFGIFAVVFFVSRLIVFPLWVLRSVVLEFPVYLDKHGLYYGLVTFLFLLQTMHIYWFYLIARMAYAFLVTGKLENDARSESEESDNEEIQTNGNVTNGSTTVEKLKEQ